MILPSLACAVAALLLKPTAPKILAENIGGVVLVSSAEEAKKAVAQEMAKPVGERNLSFLDQERFVVRRLDAENVLVLDLATGPHADGVARRQLLPLFEAQGSDDLVIDVTKLDEGRRNALGQLLTGRPVDPRTNDPIQPRSLGLYAQVEVKIDQGSGAKSVSIPLDGAAHRSMLGKLATGLMSSSAVPKPVPLPAPNELLQIRYLGSARNPNGEELAVLSAMVQDLKRQQAETDKKLGELLIRRLFGEGQPLGKDGEINPNSLDEAQRRRLELAFGQNWKRLGFADEQTARGFFRSAGKLNFSTSIGLYQLISQIGRAHV